MSIRRTFQIAAVTFALSGGVLPMFTASHAQNVPPGATDRDTTVTTTDDRTDRGMDFGWIGILGLAGLAGLLGNRRETHAMRNPSTTTAAVR